MKTPMVSVSCALLFLAGSIAFSQDTPPDTHKGKEHRKGGGAQTGTDLLKSSGGSATSADLKTGGIDPMSMPEPKRSQLKGAGSTSGVAGTGKLPGRTRLSGKRRHTARPDPYKN